MQNKSPSYNISLGRNLENSVVPPEFGKNHTYAPNSAIPITWDETKRLSLGTPLSSEMGSPECTVSVSPKPLLS